MPNNRQWATLVWACVAITWMLSNADLRAKLRDIVAALKPRLLLLLALFAAWLAGLTYLAAQVGLWGWGRATDTVMWVVTAGIVLLGRAFRVTSEDRFVRRAALSTLRLTVLLEAASEIFVFALLVEIALQPVVALFVGISVFAGGKPQYRASKQLVDGVLAAAGWGVLAYVAINLVRHWHDLDQLDLLQQLALPVWLTLGALPLIYIVGVWAAYGQLFSRINASGVGAWPRVRAKAVLVTSLQLRASQVGAFSAGWPYRLARTTSWRQTRDVIGQWRETAEATRRQATEQAEQLVRYAGIEGEDADGRRLDRREFDDTKDALRWLATCQMGWHPRRGGRYRPDLADLVLDRHVRDGRLPDPHDVRLTVSKDGQKWYAWRRTITGWVFAIGADGPPPNQWEYDGPEPPGGFPGEDPSWGTGPFDPTGNRNW